MKDIDTQADTYLAAVNKMGPSERDRKLNQIKKLFSKSSEYGDDKVALAMQTYEMVMNQKPLRADLVSLEPV